MANDPAASARPAILGMSDPVEYGYFVKVEWANTL